MARPAWTYRGARRDTLARLAVGSPESWPTYWRHLQMHWFNGSLWRVLPRVEDASDAAQEKDGVAL